MKFVCDSCGTQYLISDEKVQGKGVKVRCKRCGNVILIRPRRAAEPAAAAAVDEGMGGSTVPNGAPWPEEQDQSRQDDVGMAFDRLLQGELDSGREEDDEEEGQETQIFSMEELKKVSGVGPGPLSGEEQDKIDEVFSAAASTGISPDGSSAGDDGEEWYLAINDQQVGPMNLQEVEARWEAGDIGPDSLAWFPGMDDWQPLQEVPKLRYLLGTLKKAEQHPPGQTVEPAVDAQWNTSGSSSLSSLVEEELQAVQAVASPASSTPEPGPEQLDEAGDEPGELPPWEREDVLSGEVARPSESYFDPSLDAPTTDSGSPLTDRAGIVKPAYLLGGRQKLSRTKLMVAGGLGAVVLLAGAWLLVSSSSGRDDKSHASNTSTVNQEAGVTAGSAARKSVAKDKGTTSAQTGPGRKSGQEPGASRTEDGAKAAAVVPEQGKVASGTSNDTIVVKKTSDGSGATVKTVVAKAGSVRTSPKKTTKPARSRRRSKTRTKTSRRGNTATGKPKEVVFNTPTNPNLPKKLTPAQIKGVMKKYLAAMRKCVKMQKERDPSVKGTMIITFTIRGSGATSNVKVLSNEHRGTFVDSCISTVIKGIRFPQFSGPPIRIPRVPLRLGE